MAKAIILRENGRYEIREIDKLPYEEVVYEGFGVLKEGEIETLKEQRIIFLELSDDYVILMERAKPLEQVVKELNGG